MFSGKQLHAKESCLRKGRFVSGAQRRSPDRDLPSRSQKRTKEKVMPDSRATASREPTTRTRASQGASAAWNCGHLTVGQSRLVPYSGNSAGPPIGGFLSLHFPLRNPKEWPTPPSSSVLELQARVQASDSEQAAWSSSLRMRLGRPVGKASSVPPSPHALGSELTLSLPRLGFCHSSGQPKSPVHDTRSLTLKWSWFEGLARPAPSTRRTCQSVDICNGSLCRPQRRPPKKSQALCSRRLPQRHPGYFQYVGSLRSDSGFTGGA